jgi:hypothetical protein
MNIVLLNQFFPPARAPTGWVLADLAEELVRRGHAVTVLTSAAGYGAATGARRATPSGVRLVRVGQGGAHRTGLGAKLRDYLSFFRCAWRELEKMPRPDALVCMTTPPFSGLLGARLQARRGVPYVLWCMDLYPEALAAHGILRPWNPLAPLLRRCARRERGRAAVVVALGADMVELVAAAGARRIVEIPFWTAFAPTPALEAEARALRRARGWADDEIVLLYSGNMGRAHRADEFAALAELLGGGPRAAGSSFSGGGPQRAGLATAVGRAGSNSWPMPRRVPISRICWRPMCIWYPSSPNGGASWCRASSRPPARWGGRWCLRVRRKAPWAFGSPRPMPAGCCRRAMPPPWKRGAGDRRSCVAGRQGRECRPPACRALHAGRPLC